MMVLPHVAAVQELAAQVALLEAEGSLCAGHAKALGALLGAAANQLELGNPVAAANQLNAFPSQPGSERGIEAGVAQEPRAAAERVRRAL